MQFQLSADKLFSFLRPQVL